MCGCPLVTDVFKETGEFCRITRKKCNKHYCWEKLRRAEIDMDRVRQVSQVFVWSFWTTINNSVRFYSGSPLTTSWNKNEQFELLWQIALESSA